MKPRLQNLQPQIAGLALALCAVAAMSILPLLNPERAMAGPRRARRESIATAVAVVLLTLSRYEYHRN
jgi:hypothetical protein